MVLAVLWEAPTHPYGVVQTLKARAKDRAARLNYGSLYTVVAGLDRAGLIEAVEVTREGNLPARTTYRVTPAGERELVDWLSDLLANPQREFPAFMTALSLLPALPPDQAVGLLRERIDALEDELAQGEAALGAVARQVPELMLIEARYLMGITRAELEFTRALVGDVESGRLGGMQTWHVIHRTMADGHPDPDAIVDALRAEGFDVSEGFEAGEEGVSR
jgi:DNA-binding PadR family transcriptional regulator